MTSTSPMLFMLVAGMGLAFAVLLAAVVGERCKSAAAALISGAWYVVVFMPLALAFLDPDSTPLGVADSLDYAGSAPLHLGLGVSAAVFMFGFRRGPFRAAVAWTAVRPLSYVIVMVAVAVGWGGWLVSTEQDLNRYSGVIFANTVAMAAFAILASVLAQLLRARTVSARTVCGAFAAALAGSTACSAHLEPAAAAVLGALIGLVSTQLLERRRNRPVTALGALVATSMIVGASLGLLALGLLDVNRGFFFTGQPTLALAQITLIGVTVAYAAATSTVIAFVAVKLLGGAEWWAIPDSNR